MARRSRSTPALADWLQRTGDLQRFIDHRERIGPARFFCGLDGGSFGRLGNGLITPSLNATSIIDDDAVQHQVRLDGRAIDTATAANTAHAVQVAKFMALWCHRIADVESAEHWNQVARRIGDLRSASGMTKAAGSAIGIRGPYCVTMRAACSGGASTASSPW